MSFTLISVFTGKRAAPAYRLSRRQGVGSFVIHYKIFIGDLNNLPGLGDEVLTAKVIQVKELDTSIVSWWECRHRDTKYSDIDRVEQTPAESPFVMPEQSSSVTPHVMKSKTAHQQDSPEQSPDVTPTVMKRRTVPPNRPEQSPDVSSLVRKEVSIIMSVVFQNSVL